MSRFIFPYDKIKSGSRIILYGTGDVGKQYISQVCSLHTHTRTHTRTGGTYQIEILFAVGASGNATYAQLHQVPVYLPAKIESTDPDSYDYVVIAVEKEESVRAIRQTLSEFHIPEEKIIHDLRKYDDIKHLRHPEVRQHFQPSFSWFGEDTFVRSVFWQLGIDHPSYLDIGCNHPYVGSNTALLYLTGSTGINIDANINCIRLMDEERPDDQNICCGVLAEEGEQDFFMLSELEGLNSFSKQYIDVYIYQYRQRDPGEIKTVKVPCHTLKTIIETYCDGVFPDFFDLDIEGMDESVIASYDFSENGPKLLCVESHAPAVVSQLLAQGYARIFSTVHNLLFVQKKYLDKLIQVS